MRRSLTTSSRRGWNEAHEFTPPIVRELPRPVGLDALHASLW
jgi:hypothetical protein